MHEVGIAQDVIAAVAARVGPAPVKRLVLEIGRLSGVMPEAMRGCFALCAEGTPLERAALEIVEVPGVARCRACGAAVRLDSFFGYCACGSSDLDWQGGDELRVIRIEVESDA